MFNLLKTKKIPFGLDISEVSVKFIQLGDSSRNNFSVLGYSDNNIPKDTIVEGNFKNPAVLIQTIKQGLASPKFGKISSPYVIASIPETKSFVRVIQMPAMSAEEAREAVPWEAEAYIPLPITQVYLDWVILERDAVSHPIIAPSPQGDTDQPGSKMTVLITAAPKDYVNDLVGVLKGAGLKPLALEVESQATARSLVPHRSSEVILIADIDTIRTSFIIYDQNTLQFTSSLPIGGNSFTQSIAQALTLNFTEAERVKREVGLENDLRGKQIKKAMLPVLNNLVVEIRNTIHFYEDHVEDGKISRLFLTGGSSKLKHFPSFLADKLLRAEKSDFSLRSLPGLKVELGNPWINVLGRGKTPPLSREDSLSYTTAIGLALRNFQ